MRSKFLGTALPIVLALAVLFGLISPAAAAAPSTVNVQILAINDFHGALDPITSGGVNYGGVEYLATYVKNLRAGNPNTLFVSGGDLIGASPLLSGLFHDEPTIEAMNLMGLDYNTTGNHEFDEGVAELQRMQFGGCSPVDGCQDGDSFDGATFQFLSANVTRDNNGKTIFPAYKIRSFAGAKVAIIGIALQGTPTIVTPSGVAGLTFQGEAETINKLVPEIQAKGIHTIVVLLHDGGSASSNINACGNTDPAFANLVKSVDKDVDVFVTGHTHQAFNCNIDGRVVTSAMTNGRVLTDIDLSIDRASDQPVSVTANNVTVLDSAVSPDPDQTALLAKYRAVAAPLANRVIGKITANITRTANAAGESALGDVIADAQLWATAAADKGNAIIAFMNPGGIRADFTYDKAYGAEQPGEITYGEAFTVQPFSNGIVTMTMTGQQIKDLLEQQWVTNRTLQVSNGFSYTFAAANPVGSKVTSITLNGQPIDLAASYRVTENSFLADGGDGFTVFKSGTDRLIGGIDLDALVAYFEAMGTVAPGPQNRIIAQ